MKSFPMFFRTTGRHIVIAGGGEQAAQKARLILKTDAKLILAAPELDDELAALVEAGRAQTPFRPHHRRGVRRRCDGIHRNRLPGNRFQSARHCARYALPGQCR